MGLDAEQIEMRKTGIGASESPMLLGESPHGGPIDLYLRKMGLATFAATPAQEMGNFLEQGVADWYAYKTGSTLDHCTTLRHPEFPWMIATPDRWVNGRDRALQIKMVGPWMAHHWTDADDGIPDYVRVQVTHEMDVAGIRLMDVCAVIGGTDPHIYQIEYDPELAASIRTIVKRFWFDHVLPAIPPTVDGSPSANELLKALYPYHRTAMVDATDEAEEWALRLRAARAGIDRHTASETIAEQKLKEIIGAAEGMAGSDWTITWRANAKARPFLFKDAVEKKTRRAA